MKKGPGRRPLSAKRQRFMELRAQGWSIRGAAREVGISRSAAANWTRGTPSIEGASRPSSSSGWTDSRSARSAVGTCLNRSGSRSPTCTSKGLVFVRSHAGQADRRQRSPGSCGAIGPKAAGRATDRLRRIVARAPVAVGVAVVVCRPTPSWVTSSLSCSSSAGAPSRSAGDYANASPASRRCGSRTRASTRRSTSLAPR